MDPFPQDPLLRAEIAIAFIKDANGIVYTIFIAMGFHLGVHLTQASREIDMLRHPKPATIAYFATRIFVFATLLSACLGASIAGYSNTAAEGILASFFVFESCALSTGQGILLLRTLAMWSNHPRVRYLSFFAWLASSAIHFVKLYIYAAVANPLGIWLIFPVQPLGGKLRAVPYFVSLAFATGMTILTLVGAQRRKMPTGSGHHELTRQGGAGRGATRFMATRILHDQLLYYVIMVFSTGSTALIILFELVKGYSQFVTLVLNLVLTCSSACNIVLSMRSPIMDTLDLDHDLLLLPAGHRRVEDGVVPRQVSSSSPSLQKEAVRREAGMLGDSSFDPESGSRSTEHENDKSTLDPIEDPFWRRDEAEAALLQADVRASPVGASQSSPRTPDETGRPVAPIPHLWP